RVDVRRNEPRPEGDEELLRNPLLEVERREGEPHGDPQDDDILEAEREKDPEGDHEGVHDDLEPLPDLLEVLEERERAVSPSRGAVPRPCHRCATWTLLYGLSSEWNQKE